ncbi:cuticle protein 19.8-like [Colias croceus]|uniref:cuticle protein 19.8-like n=1 Tax=Colias crocea TaxID=72248 RepID=UPI001E27E9F2|nr:cuticle protein 19.8-like [Colias croceus]
MKYFVAITCLLALSVPSRATGYEGLVYAPGHASPEYYSYPSYEYEYSVRDPHTGDNKAVWEKRDGDVVVGGYSFVEPGGSIRIIEYRADKSGFTAPVVKRIGPKVHPGGATSTTTISKPSSPIREFAPARIISAPVIAPAPLPAPVRIPLPAPIPAPAPLPAPVYTPLPAPIYRPAPTPVYASLPAPTYTSLPAPIYKPAPIQLSLPYYSAPYIPRPSIPYSALSFLSGGHGLGHGSINNYNYDLYNSLNYH